jgi:hypothetical protein
MNIIGIDHFALWSHVTIASELALLRLNRGSSDRMFFLRNSNNHQSPVMRVLNVLFLKAGANTNYSCPLNQATVSPLHFSDEQ